MARFTAHRCQACPHLLQKIIVLKWKIAGYHIQRILSVK
jgi:hypothetical protein